MDIYDKILTEKVIQKLSYKDLGVVLDMSEAAFGMAMKRKSLNKLQIREIEQFLGIKNIGDISMNSNNNQNHTGYYLPDVYAAAGMDSEMQNQDELKRIPVNIPNWEKNTIFINVSGDSMYPEYCSGDIIGIKETEFDYIIFGFAYVVILMNGDVYLKYIKKGSDKEHIILESKNEFYESKEIHLSKVKRVYQVKGVITKKTM